MDCKKVVIADKIPRRAYCLIVGPREDCLIARIGLSVTKMSEVIASPAVPTNCPGPVRRLVPPPPAQFHPSIQSAIAKKRSPFNPPELLKLYKRFQNISAPDFPLDSRFEQIAVELAVMRDCYRAVSGSPRHSPMFDLRRVGNNYCYGLQSERRIGSESYDCVLARAFPRIRVRTALRHNPGQEKFLAAHDNMQIFVAFYEYAQTLDTPVKPNQCFQIIETFRALLDEVLETSK